MIKLLLLSIGFFGVCSWGSLPTYMVINENIEQTQPATQIAGLFVPTSDFPGFVMGMQEINGQILLITQAACFYIEQEKFWEYNDNWENRIGFPNITFMIQDMEILPSSITRMGPAITHYDSQGQFVGSYGSLFSYCFDFNLPAGDYKISITVTTTSLLVYNYEFIFSINET